MANFSEKIRSVCSFVLLRKPFLDAMTMCMVLSEREKNKKSELLPQTFVYIYIFAMFLSGTMLSFGDQRSLYALIAAGFTGAFSLIAHTIMPSIDTWLRVRMIIRDAAVIGVYLIIASRGTERLTRRYNLAWLFHYGCVMLAAFFCATSFQLVRSPEEYAALYLPYPLGDFAKIILAGVFIVGGLLLGSERETKTASWILAAALTFYIVFVDLSLGYWSRKTEFWTQMDLTISSICVLLILLLVALK